MNAKHKRWANALRDKYNKILAQNGKLYDQDYENMAADVEKCVIQDKSCRSVMFDVLEEFDGRNKQ
jgi:hypothetical protein